MQAGIGGPGLSPRENAQVGRCELRDLAIEIGQEDVGDALAGVAVPERRAVAAPLEITAKCRSTAVPSSSGSTRRLVPWLIVIGRSVFGRSVRHGTSSTVVSSWMPP